MSFVRRRPSRPIAPRRAHQRTFIPTLAFSPPPVRVVPPLARSCPISPYTPVRSLNASVAPAATSMRVPPGGRGDHCEGSVRVAGANAAQ